MPPIFGYFQIFYSSTFQDIFDYFPDVYIFCAFVSSLFVKEIRIRAIDQTSEDGSKLIAAFLEDGLSDSLEFLEASTIPSFSQVPNGNLLLLTLEKLSCSASLLECMSAAGVPSTLVKCLYIFLDLPAVPNPDAVKDRSHLQRKFTQLLQHVCLSSVAVEEMVNTDALRHLLSAAVDPCQSANAFWRKCSCTILTTLAQNCLTTHVIQYIHDAGCITDYVERLKQMQLPKADSMEAFISLFQILSESSSTTSQLLDDFHAAGGYSIITDYLLRYELEEGEEALVFCQRLTRLLGDLIYVGSKELRAKNSAIVEVFQLPGFQPNIPKAKGEAIRNIRAIDTLQVTFIQARSTNLCNELLERIRDLHQRAPGNYFILDKHHLISSITEVIATKPESVQGTFFDVFASLIEHLCYVPLQEISSVALLLRKCKYPTCLQYAFSCLLRLIITFPTMKEFYRNVGILEVTMQHLERCADTMLRSSDGRSDTAATAPSTVRKLSIYELVDLPVETPLVDLLITILRLLTAAVYQSAPDILVVSNLRGVHCVLTRLLPNPSLPPRVVKHALGLLYEIFVVSPTEDQLLGLLDVLPSANIVLRIEVLRLLCNVLRDSHRCRTIFRKCNGSVRIIHQLVLLNGCLSPSDESETVLGADKKCQLTLLIKGVIAVLTIAMKFEPASAKHFVVELQFESLEQALRLLGCFNKETVIFTASTSAVSPNCQSSSLDDSTVTSNSGDSTSEISPNLDDRLLAIFRSAFLMPSALEQVKKTDHFADIPTALLDVCLIFRYLIGMALDEFDRTSLDADQNALDSEVKGSNERLFSTSPSIVHTGAVLTILRLIPAIVQVQGYKAATLNLQYFSLELLNAVIESERSQQLLCGGGITNPGVGSMGMPRALLIHFRPALASSQHPLHVPVATLFALLAAQSLTPRDFRDFLRLSGQFCEHQQSPNGTCTKTLTNSESKTEGDEAATASGGTKAEDLPLLNLPALPAITDLLEQTVWRQRGGANRYSATTAASATAANTTCLPAFVEFNMLMEGFGCLFLPSLAPQRIIAPARSFGGDGGMGGASSTCAGGVGIGERAFPPTNGITYCSWVCVSDFGTPPSDSSTPHPVRLLTVFKGIQGTNEQLICLSIHLDPQSRALVVSSKERLLPTEGSSHRSKDAALDSPNFTGDDAHTVVFTTSSVSLWTTNVWRHVALVFARASVVRTSLCSFYLDGSLVGTQKILFAPPGSATINTSVCAFVGTPPCQYQPCSLRWRQGPFQLVEEPLTAGQVALIAALGPEYIGSLQAPPAPPNGQDILQPLFAEEKLSFAACGSTYVTLTITRIRRVYNPTDAALICKVLHMPLRENLTPIRVLRNLATQLAGAARSLGAVLVGYQGVRIFSPCALGTLLSAVADPTGLLLSFLALANTPVQLKNSLRAIFCVIGASHATATEVQRLHGYQLMAGILRKKSQFLDEEVAGLVMRFTFSQMLPAPPFQTLENLPPNSQQTRFSLNEDAFRDLLCDLKLWLRRPPQNREDAIDYALLSHLINQLASHFAWLCDDHASAETKASTEKLAKLVSDCLFDSLVFLIMDAVNEMNNNNNNNPTSAHFAELIAACMRLFSIVLLTTPNYGILQLLSRFLIWTLPRQKTKGSGEIPDETVASVAQERCTLIFVRNQCFLLLSHLLSRPKHKCLKLCDRMVSVLGFDWFHLFLSPNLHDATAAHVLRTLCLALLTFSGGEQKPSTDSEFSDFPGLVAFRKEVFIGGWMRVSTKRGQMGGTATGGLPFAAARLSSACSIEAVQTRMSNNDANGQVNGFLALSALLVNNAGMPEVYAMLIHLLLGIRTPFVPLSMFTFDELYNHLVHVISTEKSTAGLCDQTVPPPDFFLQKVPLHPLGASTGVAGFSAASETISVFTTSIHQTMHNSNLFDSIACPEAATIIISILSALMRAPLTLSSATQHMPIVMLQLFSYLYQSNFGFQTVCLSSEFLTGLIDLLVISSVSQAAYGTQRCSPDEVCEFSWHRLDELLLSFLRTIVVDSFSLPPTAHRPVHVVDTVLEAEHSSCSSKQQHEIQTMLMRNLMEYMLAKDLLSESCLLLPSRGYAQHIPQNLAYFACRLVDKLWQASLAAFFDALPRDGCFLGSISEIIDFLTQLIQMLEQHLLTILRSTSSPRHYSFTQSPSTLPSSLADPSLALSRASLYRSLNRSVLFQLSRPVLKQKDQKLAISMLQLLLSEESPLNSFIFSSFNSADTEFPVCLAHLLIQHVQRNHQIWVNLDLQEPGNVGTAVQNEMQELETPDSRLYRTAFDTEDFETDDDEEKALLSSSPPRQPLEQQRQQNEVEEQEDLPAQQEEFEQLATLALKLWEHCYIWNQKVFVALLPNSPLSQLAGIPSLLEWSVTLEGPCIMKWTTYVDAEATGCGGIVSQNASSTPTSRWGLLSMYGPSTIERQLESTNNKVTGADQLSSTPPKPIKGLSHQISKKLGRMSASVLRMASNAATGSGDGNTSTTVAEVGSAKSIESRRNGRQFSLVGSVDVSGLGATGSSSGGDADWVLVPRIPIGLPLLTKKSTTLSTLKRINMQVESPLTLVTESLEWSKQSQERDMSFLWRQVEIEWNKMEDNLTQERSIWGPMCADDDAVKWELDPTEGPCRMRKRMLPNPNFYRHYPTISRTTQAANEGMNSSLTHEESGNIQTPATTTKRGFIAPHSLGARFCYRRRRLLRGPEPPKKLEEEETAVVESPPSDTIDPSGESLTFSDIAETEDTLIRTSRLLRDSKSNTSRGVSFVDSSSEALCDTSANSVEAEAVEEVDEEDRGEAVENSSTESLDLGLDDQSPQPQPPPTPLQPKNAQQHHSSTDGTSRQSPPSKPASSSTPEGSSTALDQLNGHIAFMRLLEPVECLSSIYRCARICGLDVHEGLLLFGRNHFYVIDGYTLTNTHEIVSIEALPPGMQHKPIVPTGTDTVVMAATSHRQAHSSSYTSDLVSSGAVDQISGNQYFKFAYDKIREVHRRRYLLQQTALEVFNADGRNFFLVFAKDFQSKVYECFTAASSSINTNCFASLHSARTNSHLLSSLLGEKTVTQRWVRGEISNFQYLMYLNTQAGRSYNDLMQYPVFPWVLADYTSLHLDLSRPTTFRDFTKPMGAQTSGRLAQFQRRFREWDDPSGETPPYHYGTHYSSAMIVASYLVRMEPFSQHFIKLQGGHFDLPDRMFHSVEEAWLSASQHNMADVRELIPEFFYLPDFLVNSNHFDFGCKQNGVRVDHVLLPPWAKGDPREFVRQHREALESEYVSANLHHWIDLIFGYKQRGEPAVQAANVFHHLFYEGNVDIYAIDDPVKRRAVVGFINNFGQIPRQIFRKPHPAKKMVAFQPLSHPNILVPTGSGNNVGSLPDSRASISPASSTFFFHNLENLKPSLGAARELRHAVGQILQLEPGNLKGFSFGSGGGAITGCGGGLGSAAGNPGLGSASQLTSGGISTLILPPSGLFGISGGGSAVGGGSSGSGSGSSGDSSGSSGVAAGPIVVVEQNMVLLPPNFTRYLAWGYPDDSFRICSLIGDKVLQVFEMVNSSQVLCAAAPNASTIVTAGMTGVVKVWQLRSPNEEQGKPFCPSDWNIPIEGHGSGVVFGTTATSLQLTGCLYGHTDVVTCLAASDSFNLIVSGGRDCTCIVWDLRYLIFLRQLSTSSGGTTYKAPVAAVCISEATGDIAVCAGAWLYLWSITGDLIACLNTAPDQSNQIYCVAMTTLRDWEPGHVVITGGSDGFVRMWGLDYVCEESPDSTTSKTPCPSLTSSNDFVKLRWRRQLTLRADLTVHTAFDRSDTAPLPLMALAISRDHRSVLVGDAKGRVFAWSVPGGGSGGSGSDATSANTTGAPFSEDGSAGVCAAPACGTRFSLTERKHHCRNCGKAFCSRCSRFESEIHPLRIFRPVRVCIDCYALLAEQQGPTGP
ncbi:WD repeat and FYVE domain-containing protein 3 [Taenia crassiceps]|uniref:WD repeat and FYVE domain-containing protein 3 n=1 Tax=Taenia crassiceps TaxID=6207 RepID=A0ABR4QDR7_9CEST